MENKIRELLNEVAKEYDVEILFAVENGSRAWGMESNDSDYDVRFVFYRKPEGYTLVNPNADVITAAFNDKFEKLNSPEGSLIDMQGFDLLKFSRMLSSSNPTVIEWLNSEILYVGERPKEFVRFSRELFNPTSLYYHYKSMGRQNYVKYIKPQNFISTPKKYLYTTRGIVNSIWIKEFGNLPPIDFNVCIKNMAHDEILEKEIADILLTIINNKKNQKEKDAVDNIELLDSFIEDNLKVDEAPTKRHFHTPEYFNDVIIPIIHKQYSLVGVSE